MEKLFFNKTGCRCVLKLQEKEDLQNPRCIRCQVVSAKKVKQEQEAKLQEMKPR